MWGKSLFGLFQGYPYEAFFGDVGTNPVYRKADPHLHSEGGKWQSGASWGGMGGWMFGGPQTIQFSVKYSYLRNALQEIVTLDALACNGLHTYQT